MPNTQKELQEERDRLLEQARLSEIIAKERTVSDVSYARKEFEKAIIWFIAIVIGAVLLALMNGVLK